MWHLLVELSERHTQESKGAMIITGGPGIENCVGLVLADLLDGNFSVLHRVDHVPSTTLQHPLPPKACSMTTSPSSMKPFLWCA